MLQHVDVSSSPNWKQYMNTKGKKHQNSNPHIVPDLPLKPTIEKNYYSNENTTTNQTKLQQYSHQLDPSKTTHKRKASANVPYQFPTSNVLINTTNTVFDAPKFASTGIKGKGNTSNVQCCPELPGDIDDVVAEGPSPPKCKKNNTPASQETNETSHVTSQKKRARENSMQSEGEDSLGFLECSESLGNDKSSSSLSANEGMPLVTQDKDMQVMQEEDDIKCDQGDILDTEVTAVLSIDTLNYLIGRESKYMPDPYYMEKQQPHITPRMRLILCDWMMEVCTEYRLKRETFHYAVNYVDRYLSLVKSVNKSDLQLLGVTSMYIAAKIEETLCP